jgi:hypothetical protein
MKFIYLSLLGLTLLISCETNENTKSIHPFDLVKETNDIKSKKVINLFELNWLEGMWIDSTSFPNNTVIENWNLKEDTLIGQRGTIKKLDTTYSQTSRIFINNDQPVYLLEVEGSSFVSFKTVEFTKSSITFGNGANLAPSELTYSKKGKDLGLEFTIITQVGEREFKHLFKKQK